MLKKTSLFLVAGIITVIGGCYYDNEQMLYPGGTDCSNVSAGFAADVNPIIQSSCATTQECHGAGSVNTGGPLTNYTEIKNKTSQIRTQLLTGNMPKGSTLPSTDTKKIICWIDSGAPNN